jgi:hypothetical protein
MINEAKLDFYIRNHYNVLFVGKHGVGKSSIVVQAFDRAKLNWKYFSASTMDPWVDFIGVPKEQQTQEGTPYLELVRPLEFQSDEIEAIFFDEFNRSHKKVRNAVMELIQFKSINGKKFKNLKMVWAAINPDDDDEYDVDRLDPAQRDRFQIKLALPYKPHLPYFQGVYGRETAKAAVSWWNELPTEQKDLVSPRCLDYALDVWKKEGDIRDVLPASANASKLLTVLKNGPVVDLLKKFIAQREIEAATKWLATENNYASAIDQILKNQEFLVFFLPLMPREKVAALVAKNTRVFQCAVKSQDEKIQQLLEEIIVANQNRSLVIKLKRAGVSRNTLAKKNLPTTAKGVYIGTGKAKKPHFKRNRTTFNGNLIHQLQGLHAGRFSSTSTYDRNCAIQQLNTQMPATLNSQEALSVLQLLSAIAMRSHGATLRQWERQYKLVGMVNHCIHQISINENLVWDDLCKAPWGIHGLAIVERLAERAGERQFYCPKKVEANPWK